MTEEEMVGWHHQLDGHEFQQALGVGDGQGSLVCCSPWCGKELDTTERLHGTPLSWEGRQLTLTACPVYIGSSTLCHKLIQRNLGHLDTL